MEIPPIGTDKVIRDPVHGYIKLTDLEYDVIQLPVFLRLHRVKQSSTAYLTYPGALNSRFEHVIGALHVGFKIVTQLISTLDDNDFKNLFQKMNKNDVALLIKSVRLACLFHDLGHGPFSHAGEKPMLEATKKHNLEIEEAKKLFSINEEKDLPIHEYYSYKLIKTGEIAELLNKIDPRLTELSSSLIVKNPESQIAKENQEGVSILQKIVSGQLDADRMDYLMRDGLMSGVTYGQIDADRVIMNMVIKKDNVGRYELAIHHRALGAIEDMLDARFKMYKWLYQHHTVVATDALMQHAIRTLVDTSQIDLKIFHWSEFANGLSTDEFVLNRLIESWCKNNVKYNPFRGLWDRRYIPTSLLKRLSDYPDFANLVNKFTGRDVADEAIASKIKDFNNSPTSQSKLVSEFSSKKPPLNDTRVMIIVSGRTPYQPLSGKDNIWLFDETGEIHELMKRSPYTSHINQEWQTSPSIFISCVLPGHKKSEVTKPLREEIKQTIIKVIFSK